MAFAFAFGASPADTGGTFSKADSATLASRRRVYATVTHAGGQGSRAYRKHKYLKELTLLNEKFKAFAETKLAEIKADIDSGKIPDGEPRFFLDAAAQYAAAVKEIRERYMPTIGDVLTVGTGEMGQLGFEEDDLNALMTFYRPMLIRNLRGGGIVQVSSDGDFACTAKFALKISMRPLSIELNAHTFIYLHLPHFFVSLHAQYSSRRELNSISSSTMRGRCTPGVAMTKVPWVSSTTLCPVHPAKSTQAGFPASSRVSSPPLFPMA